MRSKATCQVTREGDRVVLGVGGELSLASAYPLITALHTAPRTAEVAVDLEDVESATPGGLEALEELLAEARALFAKVTLLHAEPLVAPA